MLERDLNGIIRKSLEEQGGFAHKISDAGQVTHSKLPFDGFGYYKGHFVAWESKWLSAPRSLDLQRLQDHQLDALKKTRDLLENAYALFLIGIDYGVRNKRVYYYINNDLSFIEIRRNQKQNILKKEFDTLQNFVKIENGRIDFKKLLGF